MDRNEVIERVKEYNKEINLLLCSSLERQYVKQINEEKYFYGFRPENIEIPSDVERFLKKNGEFRTLLKEQSENLCFYLRQMHQYTCNKNLIRMDARSNNFSYYEQSIFRVIGSFYLFEGAGLNLKSAIYGEYRQISLPIDFAPIIAVEIIKGKEEVIGYCEEVLTSENNTAVLTRDVIKAIEQSGHEKLNNLLFQVFLAAKLQEGLRQSVIETADEGRLDVFIELLDLIKKENLLRFSSVQRGVMTWIGIGYIMPQEKEIRLLFDRIHEFIHHKDAHEAGFHSENPLEVYLALYVSGLAEVDDAIEKAVELLHSEKRHIVASALIYLHLTRKFDPGKQVRVLLDHREDEWIRALYFSECAGKDLSKMQWSQSEAEEVFACLAGLLKKMKQQENYSSKGFSWYAVTLYKGNMTYVLYRLLKCVKKPWAADEFLPHVSSLHGDDLKEFMKHYFKLASEEGRKQFLLKEIISSNEKLTELIVEEYKKLTLNEKEMMELEGRLKTKKAHARAAIVKVLAAQERSLVKKCQERLLTSKDKGVRESAKELRQQVPHYFAQEERTNIEIVGKDRGFSLYVPGTRYGISYEPRIKKIKKGFFRKTEHPDLGFLLVMEKEEVLVYMKKWDDRIRKHAQDEYEIRGEIRQVGQRAFFPMNYKEKSLDVIPLGELWRKYFMEDGLTPDQLFQLLFHIHSENIKFEKIFPAEVPLFALFDLEKQFEYYNHFKTILKYYFYERKDSSYPEKAMSFLELANHYALFRQFNQTEYGGTKVMYSLTKLEIFAFMTNELRMMECSDEEFKERFPVLYETYEKFHLDCREEALSKFEIPMLVAARAVNLKLIPMKALYEIILDRHTVPKQQKNVYYGRRRHLHRLFDAYRDAYYHGRGTYGKPDLAVPEENKEALLCLREALDTIVNTLLPMETQRINEDTEVTDYVQDFQVIRGISHLIQALHVLEGEELKRQTYGRDRNIIFTNVIRDCYPAEGDCAADLAKEGFSEKRLVEAAMLAPQWIDLINEVLRWDGFKDACYYFIAHMKQYDMDKKKAEIAQYTDIEPEDLNDGAFDMGWCKSIYESLGEKRFAMIYKSAKFLCENSFHTRARKYADACLSKTSKEEFLTNAKEKRNKDALNAYCICPLTDDRDLMERYLYVQQFLKESKAFGAQRQASEKRTCEIALMNLARNSRFETVTRLSWIMEKEVINQYQSYFEPQQIEDMEARIEMDEFGRNEIKVRKNGKALKSIPAKMKNNETVQKLKEVHSLLSNQFKRSKKMLETAMEERLVFGKEEMEAIAGNPVAAPILKLLVLRNEDHLGFYEEGNLRGLSETYELSGDIYIAHPYDMHVLGQWKDFQKYVFEKELVQPFKQIFRELYLKLEEEKPKNMTKRYTGYQIQPKKAAGALKSRRWNASYESGLERVYHKEDLVVHLYAEADWFSPSDIEAPSVDYVAFYHRKSREGYLIEEIDDVVFSEIMRDVDLAVSTSYVGGVDPVTSFSTMELRGAIIEYTCKLMKLSNVSVEGHFANIEGKHNNYHVHLGSGMIHQDGGASIHMVPVYSGKRGKVYLPFLDEDPMSAQILTKVIMLSEDTKMKDPAILSQIVTRK